MGVHSLLQLKITRLQSSFRHDQEKEKNFRSMYPITNQTKKKEKKELPKMEKRKNPFINPPSKSRRLAYPSTTTTATTTTLPARAHAQVTNLGPPNLPQADLLCPEESPRLRNREADPADKVLPYLHSSNDRANSKARGRIGSTEKVETGCACASAFTPMRGEG